MEIAFRCVFNLDETSLHLNNTQIGDQYPKCLFNIRVHCLANCRLLRGRLQGAVGGEEIVLKNYDLGGLWEVNKLVFKAFMGFDAYCRSIIGKNNCKMS